MLDRTGGLSVLNLLSMPLLHGFYLKIWAHFMVYRAVY